MNARSPKAAAIHAVMAGMDSDRPTPAGHLMSSLIDQDITHIRRVMPLALSGDLAGPILPSTYWRKRLHRLLDTGYVNKGQLSEIDSLLNVLDEYDLKAAGDADETSGQRAAAGGSTLA
ncbi:hypothetical protein [Paraburkholderia adhaesiva]|uniref:hypothetical protein n=1 Tax=Paraburkholderia adhaesiva TaxID=2883244 RepID=UPI001F3B94CF|nr:hypothetical protein [Paraburkholderia adhaesiva]